MAPLRVGVVGATGETGSSIINGLLEAGGFYIIALTRPASLDKPANAALKEKGIEIRALDLKASQDRIVAALQGVDVLISAIGPREQLEQLPLATAAKIQKEVVYSHVKQLYLPYTILDVGWWYHISYPRLPSGKIDYAVGIPGQHIPGDGSVPSALTDLRDIGRYVARIIVDYRTLNKLVLVYNELWTPNQIYDLLERLSGEKLERQYNSLETLQARIVDANTKLAASPDDVMLAMQKVSAQYYISWGVRGDNTPEYAAYLGYVTSKELYPDFDFTTFEDFIKEVLAGKGKAVYEQLRKQIAAALKQ
ncbi:hypothetical protein LTR36_009747 [Oleoguttula mirabilis]|uniref:NmrA-like domain-containing protein n=1 Tax=Oleoguttula mirabilis TaxID=1507867 RepID=A0AAV9J5A8_9PEZI|nr:hypothetical protein LTR36_009747 [Oleoguttula mirabilis]